MKIRFKSIILTLWVYLVVCSLSCKETVKQKKNLQSNEKISLRTQKDGNAKSDVYELILERYLKDFSGYIYLGERGQSLFTKLINRQIDSLDFYTKISELDEQIQQNDSLKKTLYIQSVYEENNLDLSNWVALDNNNNDEVAKIETFINKKHKLSLKTLNTKLVNLETYQTDKSNFSGNNEVGRFFFSDIYFSEDNSAFLYFEFICGSKCGEGAVAKLSKKKSNWVIDNLYTIWEN